MQKTLDTIISEYLSVAIKNRTTLHKFPTIRDVIDVSYKLNLALIFLNLCELFTEYIGFHALCKLALRKFILPFLSLRQIHPHD